ncbi:IS6 family transposase, partial [Salmonella enterica]|uniref:IS6 family transposase n=1 Tax=Salmonella enterica TaxID=28901 RepID=UPI00092CF72E
MNPFKGRHFQRDIILWAVRWYCKYGISYRELQEMLAERGVNVDHSTIYRWVQRYAPEMEKRLRWYWRNPSDLCPWHMDETYVKVNGRWAYLYRAVDSRGRTVDFYLSSRRNSKAAYRFLGKILNNIQFTPGDFTRAINDNVKLIAETAPDANNLLRQYVAFASQRAASHLNDELKGALLQ